MGNKENNLFVCEGRTEESFGEKPSAFALMRLLDELTLELQKPREKRYLPKAAGIEDHLRNTLSLEDIDESHLDILFASKSLIMKKLLFLAARRSPFPPETERILMRLIREKECDRDIMWLVFDYFADKVPQNPEDRDFLVRRSLLYLRKRQYRRWELGFVLAKEGQYAVINEVLKQQLTVEQIPVECMALIVNNGEKILGSDYLEVLRNISLKSENEALKALVKSKVDDVDANNVEGDMALEFAKYKSKFEGALLGHAIGDAIGNPVELMTREQIEEEFGGEVQDFMSSPYSGEPLGMTTDDSVLTVLLLQNILENKGFNAKSYARLLADYQKLVDNGKAPFRHFSKRTESALRTAGLGQELRFCGNDSSSNGSIIRVLPLAMLSMIDEKMALREQVKECVVFTHNNVEATEGAYLTVQILKRLFGRDHVDANEFIKELIDETESVNFRNKLTKLQVLLASGADAKTAAKDLGTTSLVTETLPYALYCFLHSDDFETVMKSAINIDGDSDSIAAVAGSFWGALKGKEGLPEHWINIVDCRNKISECLSQKPSKYWC